MAKDNLSESWRADIAAAVETMKKGGIILYPTDTIWGLGCDARNEQAVKRIYEIKKRDDSKALICLVSSLAMLESTVDVIPEVAEQLIDVSVEPVTIVYDKGRNVAKNILSADGSLGVRLTKEPFSAALCRFMRGAVVSTSANVSGDVAPRSFNQICNEILESVDYVCTSRRDEMPSSKASTVIKISNNGVFKILRK